MALTGRAYSVAAMIGTLAAAVAAARALALPCPWGEGVCLLPSVDAGQAGLRWAVALVLMLHGLLPGWLLSTALRVPSLVRLGFAVPLSAVIWVFLHTVLHCLGIPRSAIPAAAGVATADLVLLWVCRADLRGLRPTKGEVLAALAGLSVLAVFGPARIAVQSFDGDGVEAFSFASSLRTRLLPFWDLENGTWGFYPAFMSFAYPMQLSSALLGESEAAARVPVLPLAAALAALVGAGHRGLMRGALMAASLVVVATSGLNYTYEPYAADIAEPTVTDLFFTLGLLTMVWAWLQRRLGLFALTAAFAVTGQPAGMPCAVLLVGGGMLRRDSRVFAFRAAGLLAGILLARTVMERLSNPPGATKFTVSSFLAHHTRTFTSRLGGRQIVTQLWTLLVQTSGAPLVFAAAFLRDIRRNGERRAVYLALAAYLVAVVFSPKRHPHYLTPVAAMILFLVPSGIPLPRWWLGLIAICLAGILPPRHCPPDTRAAEFGRATMVSFPTEQEAVENADLLYRVLIVPPWRDEGQWGIGKHAWLLYAARVDSVPSQSPEGIHVLFTRDEYDWEGFVPVTDNGAAYLYESPPGWMEAWRGQGGPTHCWGFLLRVPGRLWDPLSRWKP
ncbi:hypothetical protein JXA88_13350 [Candidatus Fermentibacteria bacterium]|nr:hypothetical protein [Candidatus Fermentibacteria bacterium]